uniref:Uncharacterized protein n=1 Tax=Anguilla anguilla TaxID=7936 RepID=A0A0E9UEL3_ANGAN
MYPIKTKENKNLKRLMVMFPTHRVNGNLSSSCWMSS